MSSKNGGKKQHRYTRFAWFIAVLGLGILIAEFWARQHFGDTSPWPEPFELTLPSALFTAHPTLGYQYKPNETAFFPGPENEFEVNYQINELGLRDSGMFSSGPKQPLVLVLGDALTEGYGVMREATFTLEMQRRLRFQKETQVYPRILNAATTGFGAAQSAIRGKHLTESLKPKLVIFVYTSLMPVADFRFSQSNSSPAAPSVRITGSRASSRPKLLRLFIDYLRAGRAQTLIELGDPRTDIFAATRTTSTARALHEDSLKHVQTLITLATKNDAKFLLLHVPLPHQVALDEWSRGRIAHRIEDKIYDPLESEPLNALCESRNISCLFATPAFRQLAAQRSSRIYFPNSYALTEVGHMALVELLIDHVRTALAL